MLAFIIWFVVSMAFVLLGIYAFALKDAMGFWANAKTIDVNNVRKYNNAMGKLFITFGVVLAILGLPLLAGQNSPLVMLSVVGVMAETITVMIVYTLVIEKKYRKK